MSRIAVLLSSYNGERYIHRQVASILNQTATDVHLYIRDDGSSDGTLRCLREFLSQDKQLEFDVQMASGQSSWTLDDSLITIIKDKNVGFLKSFMKLLSMVEDATYYSFADQDDEWLPDKLKRAQDWLDNCQESDVPILFHSAYDVIDDAGNVVNQFYFPNEGYDFRRSITENHYSGFAMVINQAMRQAMLQCDLEQVGYHDWLAGMLAHGLGVGYSDNQIMAHHFAHGDNVTTFSLKTRLQWLRDTLTKESELKRRAVEFERCYGQQLSEENQKVLALFTNPRYSLIKAIKKACYPKRWRPILSSELVMRGLMLIGRV